MRRSKSAWVRRCYRRPTPDALILADTKDHAERSTCSSSRMFIAELADGLMNRARQASKLNAGVLSGSP